MNWTLIPRLSVPNWAYWEKHYPDGLGPSIFSSPGWQRLMQQELGPPWQIRFLQCRTTRGRLLSLPVMVKRSPWRRLEIITRPVAYYVTPIEGYPTCCEDAVPSLVRAARTPFTAALTWWLPPWCVWRPREITAGGCRACDRSAVSPWCSLRRGVGADPGWDGISMPLRESTYLITLNESTPEYLAKRVQKNQRQHARSSLEMGLEVVVHPAPELVEEYYQLYLRVWNERAWEGVPYSLAFFQGVRTALGRGGELVLTRYHDRIIGGGVLLFDRYAAHLYQATTDRAVRGIYPHPVLYQTAMERAEARGLRFLNLGGVNEGNEGLKRFKGDWGALPTPVSVIRWRYRGWDMVRRLCHVATTAVFGQAPVVSSR